MQGFELKVQDEEQSEASSPQAEGAYAPSASRMRPLPPAASVELTGRSSGHVADNHDV